MKTFRECPGRLWGFVRLCFLSALCGMAACGGGASAAPLADPELPPEWDPLLTLPLTVSTAAGSWQISVWTWPQPAIKGSIDVVYRILDPSRVPRDDLGLEVVPWMPAHAHGTNPPEVTPQGDGYYLLKPVYLYMSGQWQLRTTVGGRSGDSVTPVVDIP